MTVIEIAKNRSSRWVILVDNVPVERKLIVTKSYATSRIARTTARKFVQAPEGYRFKWRRGRHFPEHEKGLEVRYYHVFEGGTE